MIQRKLSAGDIIEARCTKCRAVLNHRIVAMVEERPVRVECNTCGGVHNYYPAGESKAPASRSVVRKLDASPRKAERGQKCTDPGEWESLYKAVDRSQAATYDMNGKYAANDTIEHPVFGFGVVKLTIRPNKMEVLFQEGKKLLRCSV
ncbi:MAG TPA: hypothetical protein VJ161_03685 [Geobacteraceae bacterium]|nr:hypothetical protein [Geobacteraceae bacterium]